ncbi:hypothetical protein GAS36_01040 [Phocaeicola vulgatus]|jgi:hypothetical protein|uniref:Uncharacterized protein n=1 Tax=Phocaeicola vulgatus TaxID=821 RepID=A0A6I0HLM7_PHOVU|nr:hypothetical protein GAS29_01040 [Phocaeicola vulgatus]KAB3870887.1 hypothetical protein GAS07_00740 [Phocaeicola vulgatus]KAB3872623.1 hypothetical protein GAS14_01760 [Phocaeicola vulgatus]KAB3886942.1 hypothetical protein GAS24_00065 [Phocaeicola vulgatus]KAB3887523.1 hypothetical protein GAS36_01040 [Phocaeicola vulgatus]
MGFTTQCFIHKNTANIRNRLKELGYYCNPYLGWHNLFTCVFGVNSVYSLDDYDTNGLKEIDGLIDCGTNEDLFLAIAALRDDTDKNQWFTDGDLWFKCGDETVEYHLNHLNECGRKIHKATVDELIEHFKTKEEQ